MILDAVYASGGAAVSVTDESIVSAVRHVSASDGVFMCPEGAATVVALQTLVKNKFIQPSESVVLFNTAAGNKYPEIITD